MRWPEGLDTLARGLRYAMLDPMATVQFYHILSEGETRYRIGEGP